MKESTQSVYFFAANKSEGNSSMVNLLGGKGANLSEMCNLGIPVPPGFTISADVSTYFYKHKKQYPDELKSEVLKNLVWNPNSFILILLFPDLQNLIYMDDNLSSWLLEILRNGV